MESTFEITATVLYKGKIFLKSKDQDYLCNIQ